MIEKAVSWLNHRVSREREKDTFFFLAFLGAILKSASTLSFFGSMIARLHEGCGRREVGGRRRISFVMGILCNEKKCEGIAVLIHISSLG